MNSDIKIKKGNNFSFFGPMKRNLKYLPGNIQDPIKNMYLESAFHKL